MARAKTAPEPVVEDSNGDRDWSNLKDKDTTWMHEAFAEFILDEAGIKVPPKHVQAVTAMRVAFRKSDLYLDAKDENAKAQEEETTPEPPKAKTTRSRSTKAKAEQEPAKTTTRARRTRKGKTEPTVTVAKDEDDTPAPKATRSRRTRRTKATTDDASTTPEAPF